MFTFSKPKCDIEALILKIKHSMADELKAALNVSDVEIDCMTHKQGVDVIFSFVKPTLSPVRKKISHQIRADAAKKRSSEIIYKEVYEGLLRLGEIRLNEMVK